MSQRRKVRRSPKQERALSTFTLVLEAAAKVLVDRGYARTTTNHVARKAGISIGTLYQYFDDKEEILEALLTRHCEVSGKVLHDALQASAHLSLEEVIDQTSDAIVDLHFERYDICNVFYNELPREGAYRILGKHIEDCAQVVEAYLSARRHKWRMRDGKLASRILVHAIVGALFGAAGDQMSEDAQKEFKAEMRNLARAYLLQNAR